VTIPLQPPLQFCEVCLFVAVFTGGEFLVVEVFTDRDVRRVCACAENAPDKTAMQMTNENNLLIKFICERFFINVFPL
jgi:hypothetical protein